MKVHRTQYKLFTMVGWRHLKKITFTVHEFCLVCFAICTVCASILAMMPQKAWHWRWQCRVHRGPCWKQVTWKRLGRVLWEVALAESRNQASAEDARNLPERSCVAQPLCRNWIAALNLFDRFHVMTTMMPVIMASLGSVGPFFSWFWLGVWWFYVILLMLWQNRPKWQVLLFRGSSNMFLTFRVMMRMWMNYTIRHVVSD